MRSATASLDAPECRSDHGVSVLPCHVDLTLNQPKADVKTTGPTNGEFSHNDAACVNKGIAEVNGENRSYVVTAGTVSGICVATFIEKDSSGKTIGAAKLGIAFFKRDHCPPTC